MAGDVVAVRVQGVSILQEGSGREGGREMEGRRDREDAMRP